MNSLNQRLKLGVKVNEDLFGEMSNQQSMLGSDNKEDEDPFDIVGTEFNNTNWQ